jgi:antitoxin ParD1/3/4
MSSKHAMNVSLTAELCEFISKQVTSGRFRTSSEVVRAALRLLDKEEREIHHPSSLAHRALLASKRES